MADPQQPTYSVSESLQNFKSNFAIVVSDFLMVAKDILGFESETFGVLTTHLMKRLDEKINNRTKKKSILSRKNNQADKGVELKRSALTAFLKKFEILELGDNVTQSDATILGWTKIGTFNELWLIFTNTCQGFALAEMDTLSAVERSNIILVSKAPEILAYNNARRLFHNFLKFVQVSIDREVERVRRNVQILSLGVSDISISKTMFFEKLNKLVEATKSSSKSFFPWTPSYGQDTIAETQKMYLDELNIIKSSVEGGSLLISGNSTKEDVQRLFIRSAMFLSNKIQHVELNIQEHKSKFTSNSSSSKGIVDLNSKFTLAQLLTSLIYDFQALKIQFNNLLEKANGNSLVAASLGSEYLLLLEKQIITVSQICSTQVDELTKQLNQETTNSSHITTDIINLIDVCENDLEVMVELIGFSPQKTTTHPIGKATSNTCWSNFDVLLAQAITTTIATLFKIKTAVELVAAKTNL